MENSVQDGSIAVLHEVRYKASNYMDDTVNIK